MEVREAAFPKSVAPPSPHLMKVRQTLVMPTASFSILPVMQFQTTEVLAYAGKSCPLAQFSWLPPAGCDTAGQSSSSW
jgi:hypothetical protein